MMNFLFGHCNDPRHLVLTLGELTCGAGTIVSWIFALAFIGAIIAGIGYTVGYLNR